MQTPLNLEKEHHSLLQRWSKKYPECENHPETEFTWDGPSDWSQWTLQQTKILFLLKEAHSGYQPKCPIYEIENRFIRNIVRWKNIIQSAIKSSPERPEFSDRNIELGVLCDIAIVEVKKLQEGKKSSNYKEIMRCAISDKDFLKQQIDLLGPHVVFCGGTIDFYDKIYDEQYNPYELLNPVDKVNCWKLNDRLVIDFYHPSHRRDDNEMDSLLSSLLRGSNIRSKFNWLVKGS